MQPRPRTEHRRGRSCKAGRIVGTVARVLLVALAFVVANATTAQAAGNEPGWAPPTGATWVSRTMSYLGVSVVVGVLSTMAFVWRIAVGWWVLHRAAVTGTVVVALAAIAQLGILAGEHAGRPPWAALSSLVDVTRTDRGAALAARVVVALGLAGLLRLSRRDLRQAWKSLALFVAVLLATWSVAGHAWSQRWRVAGVALDVVHHGAAAVWLGSAAVVAFAALRGAAAGQEHVLTERFSRLSSVAVTVVVVTGVAQTVRLTPSPADLTADHGRLLLMKLAVTVVALAAGVAAQRRVRTWRRAMDAPEPATIRPLRRLLLAEVALGAAVIGVTAMLAITVPVAPGT
jgi:copper transport protein